MEITPSPAINEAGSADFGFFEVCGSFLAEASVIAYEIPSMTDDAAGNLTQDGTGMGTHPAGREDAENHMVSVDWSPTTPCGYANNDATVCYTYNALGERVQGVYSGSAYPGTFEWLFDSNGEELSECDGGYDSGGRCWYSSWVRLGGRSIADYWPTNLTAFNHPDDLGSTAMVTVWDGTVATDMRYYPFGQIWQNAGRGMWDVHFAGMQYPETNFGPWLMPTDFRKYHPTLGRWLSPDPLAGDITNPQSLNRYAYVLNNPATLTDPSGLKPPYLLDPSTCDGIACVGGGGGDPFFALDYLITGEGFYGGGKGDPGDWYGGNFNGTVFGNYGGWGGGGGGSSVLTANQVTYLVHENNLSSFCDDLIDCIIFNESSVSGGYNASAVPLKKGRPIPGATPRGLMQISTAAATDVANSKDFSGFPSASALYGDLFDPATNIQAGSAYVDILVSRWGSLNTALAKYGTGANYATNILNCVQKLQAGDVTGAMGAAQGH